MFIPSRIFGISRLAASQPTRHVIDGIHIKRKGDKCMAEATDGRVMVRLCWDDAGVDAQMPDSMKDDKKVEDYKTVVPRSCWEELGRHLKKIRAVSMVRYHWARLRERPNPKREKSVCGFEGPARQLEFTTSGKDGDYGAVAKELDGKFPDVGVAIPMYRIGSDAVAIGVNAALLSKVLHVFDEAVCNADRKAVTLFIPHDPSNPIVVAAGCKDDDIYGLAVVMPISIVDSKQVHSTATILQSVRDAVHEIVQLCDGACFKNSDLMASENVTKIRKLAAKVSKLLKQ